MIEKQSNKIKNTYKGDILGQKFGRWKVLFKKITTKQGVVMWECICECGTVKLVSAPSLQRGHSRSCGCLRKEILFKMSISHGGTSGRYHPLYKTWCNMRNRCYNEKDSSYKNYGARGIKVCDQWLGKEGFASFVKSMGCKPSGNVSLDRIDNNLGYSPENCRWATKIEQNNNRRDNVKIEFKGINETATFWSKKTGLPRKNILQRKRLGWPAEKIFSTPIKNDNYPTSNSI